MFKNTDTIKVTSPLSTYLSQANKDIRIVDTGLPDVDSVRVNGKHIFCIPKGGNDHDPYYIFATGHKKMDVSGYDVKHRNWNGMWKKLYNLGYITRDIKNKYLDKL